MSTKKQSQHRIKIPTLATIICGLLTIIFDFMHFQNENAKEALYLRTSEFEKLAGSIMYLDEVLTMSARMVAVTGEAQWEDRYNEFDPILDTTIKQLLQQFPEFATAKDTDQANQELVKMERQSFSLVKSRPQEAYALLIGEKYQNYKKTYRDGIDNAKRRQTELLRAKAKKTHMISTISYVLEVILLLSTLLSVLFLFSRLQATNRNLSSLSKKLEGQIEEKTQQLIQHSKLAALGEMSAGVAHEINNPLTIIAGTTILLPKVLDDPAKFKNKLEIIHKAVQRIAKIVMGLKKFARADENHVLTPNILSDILREVTILIEPKAKRHGVQLTFEYNSRACINCAEIEIEQVFINLISNAIDAVKMKPDKWVKVSVFEDTTSVFVSIMDSGTGLPENVRAKLFEPFFTTKAVGEGTGLGLSITKGILDAHNASIRVVDDVPNTCFEIRFSKVESSTHVA